MFVDNACELGTQVDINCVADLYHLGIGVCVTEGVRSRHSSYQPWYRSSYPWGTEQSLLGRIDNSIINE